MVALTDTAKVRQDPETSSKVFDLTGRSVFVAGHRGMVGSAIVRRLVEMNSRVLTVGRERLDLLRQDATAQRRKLDAMAGAPNGTVHHWAATGATAKKLSHRP
jgi:GDP-L-fucose synthase